MAPRRLLVTVVAAAALAALVVPGALLARAALADVAVEVVPAPEGTFQAVLAPAGRGGEMALGVGPYPPGDGLRYALRVLVGTERATNSFVLDLLTEDGTWLARCSFGSGDYRVEPHSQSATLACPVDEPEALRTVVVTAAAAESAAAIQVRRRDDGRYEAGALHAVQPRGVSAALERLSVARAPAFGAPTMLAALGLSTALLVAALLLAATLLDAPLRGRAVGERPRPPWRP